MKTKQAKSFTGGSMFTCGGGSSLGCIQGGFEERFACDLDPYCKESYDNNRPLFGKAPYLCRDVRGISPEELLAVSGLASGELDLLEASPPCTYISRTNPEARHDHEMNYLFREVFKHMHPHALYPKVVIMENVDNLTHDNFKPLLDKIKFEALSLNYHFEYRVLNAKDYGVPQSRKRTIFIFVRKDIEILPVFPEPTGSIITVKDVLPEIIAFSGGNFKDRVYLTDKPCCTLTSTRGLTFYDKNGKRYPTTEELRIIQAFPAEYKFHGSQTKIQHMIGNSVPPRLMYHISKTIREQILEPYYAGLNGTENS